MANKTYKCNIIFKGGSPAQKVMIEANNPPQAKSFAEARYPGGKCTSANQVSN